jgi:hypothetical protein
MCASSATPPPESGRRLEAARRLVATAPAALAREAAVTGSAARGVADLHSDVELNLWVDALPEAAAACAWLETAGATDVVATYWHDDPTGFRWVVGRFEELWFEVGWSTVAAFGALVRELAAGAFTDHLLLQLGQTVAEAVPLRSDGLLATWKDVLAAYPDGLAERIVADQTAAWSDPHVPEVRRVLAARGERFGLALRFTWDVQNLLRVLFAVNRVWDRDLKWTDEHSLALRLAPRDLSRRLDECLRFDDLERSVQLEQQLILETLELAAAEGFAVDAALASLRRRPDGTAPQRSGLSAA